MKKGRLHVLSTGKQEPEQLTKIAAAIHPYIDAIHIREKLKTAKQLSEIIQLMTDKGVPLSKIIINDRLDVAYIWQAAGVHLGYQSLPADLVKQHFPSMQIGCSVHSLLEMSLPASAAADYLIFGHVFPTSSKPGLEPKGLEALKKLTSKSTLPILAIGGIQPDNAKEVMENGAAGIAVMSGIMEAEDPVKAVNQYRNALSS